MAELGSAPSPPSSRALTAAAVALLSIAVWLLPCPADADPKRIYLANDDHTDYFWSGDDVQYRAAFLSMLDFYMAQAEATASRPPDSRGRFNVDGSLWVWEYERNKTAPEFARLMDHVRAGDITVPLNNAVLCYGGMPAEAVLRSMYYAGRLERRENLRLPLALAMENQTMPGGLASLWAGSGARYSWRGVCGCATRTEYGNRPRDIYHYTGPDGQSVCMKWNTKPSGINAVVGSYDEARRPTATTQFLDTDPGFRARWPWPVSAAFGFGGDDLVSQTDSLIQVSERLSTPDRRVIVSNEIDFFEDFLSHHAAEIPRFSGSFGNEWDLYSASMGALTARFKAEIEKLRTAEALAAVAALVDPVFLAGREAARDRAFMAAGLYYEHDWTADGPVARERRAQFQRDMLRDLEGYVEPLAADALAAVAARVATPAGVERHLVFNPLSWSRTDFADLAVATPPPLHVVDVETGAAVPSQVLPGGPGTRVRIRAADVPSVGYKVYEVRAGAGPAFPASASVTLPSVDNGIYAVRLGGRGNLTSLIDHGNGERQLVESGASLHDLGSGSGSVTLESSGPVSTTLRVVAGGTPAHETRVTLYAGIDRVDVEGRITQNFSTNVSYASRFALPGALMRHEEVGMIAKVARAAQGGDYADQNARTDYLSFNHFVDLSLADRGVTVSNWDSPFFRAGASTPTFLDAATPAIEAVVGMQVDGYSYGIMNQGGDTQFLNRFALRGHGAYDPAAAMRFALEHQNPLVSARATGDAASPLPPVAWSLIALPSPDVLLWALKPAEEGIGQGLVARVWNLAEGARTTTLALPRLGIAEARRTTHIETDLGPLATVAGAVPLELARQQMTTVRILPLRRPGEHVTLLSPADGSFFATGDTLPLRFALESGDPASIAARWEVDRVDGDRVEANRFVVTDATGTFVAEAGEAGGATRYDVRLIVTAPDGAPDTTRASVFPEIDLVPTAVVTDPDPIGDAEPARYAFTIANRGRMPSPRFRWQLVAEATTLASGDTSVAALDRVDLALELPPRLAGGAWTLRAVADTLGAVRETDEGNNAASRALVVTDRLAPRFVSGPTVTVGSDTAGVAWETDERAGGTVEYGATEALGDSLATATAATRQALRLAGLTPGTRYHYRVTVRDAAGNATASAIDTFRTAANLAPVARAAATPAAGLAPLSVGFSSAGSFDPEGGAITVRWAFGDGQSGTDPNPTHVYAAGRYDAVVTVTDAAGASGSATVTIVAGALPPFPGTAELDDFDRPDAALGGSWIDNVAGLSIRSGQLAQTTSNVWSTPVWGGAVYGPDQEAWVTLAAITSTSPEHDVLLKVQGNSHLGGHIEVKYDATVKKVYVSTYHPTGGWVTYGSVAVTMVAGDRFGARALGNGTVEVYRNAARLLTASVASWPFASAGGRIGLTLAKATSSRLDHFGGGTLGPDLTPPAFTSGPTASAGRDSATVQWSAGEPARGAVRYGAGGSAGDSVVVAPASSATVTLRGLARGTTYSYGVAISDAAGNTRVSPAATFITLPNRPPVAAAAGAPLTGAAPLTVNLSAAGSSDPDGDALSFAWSFGDGSTAGGATVSHRFPRAGVHPVTLTVDDGHGATATATLTVTALDTPPVAVIATPAPEAFFALGDTIALSGGGSDAQDEPGSLGLRWEVDLHDGAGTLVNAHAFAAPTAAFVATGRGDDVGLWYRARLIVTDAAGLSDSAEATLHPEVDFAATGLSATPATPRAGEPMTVSITLANQGRMSAEAARWTLTVDGAVAAEGDVTIAPHDSAVVTPALAAGLLAGDHALAVRVDALDQVAEPDELNNAATLVTHVLPPPDLTPPGFASGPTVTPGRNAATVQWTTTEPAGGMVRWQTADGGLDSVATPLATTHTATIAGLARATAYEATVAITDESANVRISDVLAFTTLPNRAPVAVAAASPVAGLAPLAVTFSSAGSSDPDGDPLGYAWSFGNGQFGAAASPSVTYAAGTWVAVLQTSDGLGGVDTASVTIVAQAAPPPFPATVVRDNFNRSSGALGGLWVDQISSLTISSNRLAPTTSSARSPVWNGGVFGPDQEAFVRLSSMGSSATDLDLMLKVQGTTWGSGHLQIRYDHKNGRLSVSTYTPGIGWKSYGSVSMRYSSADVLGARAYANGTVDVYRNGVKIRTWSVASWAYAARGGRLGLTIAGSTSTRLDDFGGGDVGAPIAALARPPVATEAEAAGPVAGDAAAPGAAARPRLSEAFPNPSHGSVAFQLELPRGGAVDLAVVDVQGRTVWSESRDYGAGRWSLSWSGERRSGGRAPHGLYFLRAAAGGARFTRRFVLLK